MQGTVIKSRTGIRQECQSQAFTNGIWTRVDNGIAHYPLFALSYYFKTLFGCRVHQSVCGGTDVSQCLTIIDQTILFYFLPHPSAPPAALSAVLLVRLARNTDSLTAGARRDYITTLRLTQSNGGIRESELPNESVVSYKQSHFPPK